MYIDEQRNMQKHMMEMCGKAMNGQYGLKQVREVLTDEAAETMAVVGVVISQPDNSNCNFDIYLLYLHLLNTCLKRKLIFTIHKGN